VSNDHISIQACALGTELNCMFVYVCFPPQCVDI